MQPHRECQRMQTFHTPLKCLALGKKSIEQLRPSAPQGISALELLLFCHFHILYITAHYTYGMLILPRAHRACQPSLGMPLGNACVCLTWPDPVLHQGKSGLVACSVQRVPITVQNSVTEVHDKQEIQNFECEWRVN